MAFQEEAKVLEHSFSVFYGVHGIIFHRINANKISNLHKSIKTQITTLLLLFMRKDYKQFGYGAKIQFWNSLKVCTFE